MNYIQSLTYAENIENFGELLEFDLTELSMALQVLLEQDAGPAFKKIVDWYDAVYQNENKRSGRNTIYSLCCIADAISTANSCPIRAKEMFGKLYGDID